FWKYLSSASQPLHAQVRRSSTGPSLNSLARSTDFLPSGDLRTILGACLGASSLQANEVTRSADSSVDNMRRMAGPPWSRWDRERQNPKVLTHCRHPTSVNDPPRIATKYLLSWKLY